MKKNLNTLLNRVDTRLAACAAVAAGATVAAVPAAHADLVYSGPVSINIPSTTDGIYLNVVTGVSGGTGTATTGWDINPYSSTSLNFFTPTGGGYVGTGTNYFNLAMGTSISSASTFVTGVDTISSTTPLNLNSSNNLFGFRFLNESTGATDYGWVRISLSTTAQAQPRAIVEYAYDNLGGAVFAGQIPEPSTYALLGVVALGALGVRVWRMRKAA